MVNEILDELSSQGYCIPKPLSISGKVLPFEVVLEALLPNASLQEAADILGVAKASLAVHISRHYTRVFTDKPGGTLTWGKYFISKLGLLVCSKCLETKPTEYYSRSVGKYLDKSTICKQCSSNYNKNYYIDNKDRCNLRSAEHYKENKQMYVEKSARRRANKLQATPLWVDKEKIKQVYLSCPPGHHVDHIIPLNNSLVCGLHVHNNLQCIPAKDNLEKSNIFNENVLN